MTSSVEIDPKSRRTGISATTYFAWVVVLSALLFFTAAALRPSLGSTVRVALGLEKRAVATSGSFYTARVAPLFEERCTKCHGDIRDKAGLRLDSFDVARRGGKHGAVVVPGDPKASELMARLILPRDDARAMPPAGQDPLSTDEVTVMSLWIASGASGDLAVAQIKNAPPPAMKVDFPAIDEAAVAQARASLAKEVEHLQARFPGALTYESRNSADLLLNASLFGRGFGDEEFALFARVSGRIVDADFSGTGMTDASGQGFPAYSKLRALRLANTAITDATVESLRLLPVLRSLTVIGSSFAPGKLGELRDRGIRIYDGRELSAELARQ